MNYGLMGILRPARSRHDGRMNISVIDKFLPAVTIASAIGCGINAGVMFAFSTSIMPGLKTMPAAQAITTMNAFNKAIENPLFLSLFTGTGLVCAAIAVATPFADHSGGALRIAGGALFAVGLFGLTMVVNVPMNNHLMTLDPTAAGSAKEWADYVSHWTAANNVRTVAGLASAALLTLSAIRA